ncbi:MAG: peroxiredoxin [Alphaproteobacteria bacterium]|nr:peroxiredoxin [Alphaproteobacteria bacterium]MBV9372217.1 peroxiredoxin [Alphaproteobacteria bacterium]MBV9901672.1 peroxiredoxin [Alphaproteobacteria bacterium]
MRIFVTAAAAALALLPASASAALPQGGKAPDFRTVGALAGKPFRLHLAEQLRRGPVVLYFFPKAFTKGCTLEAHAFSEAAGEFKKMGASVVGLSADDYETLRRFSVEECRNAFPVAMASSATIGAYDVRFKEGAALTNRTSYVIAPDGRILLAYSDLDWKNHVANSLAAVKAWRAAHRR